MENSKKSDAESNDLQQMEEIRALLLGENGELVRKTLRENAREVVGEVFSEALHDREKQDGSVKKVLLPLVEKSVEKSVANHSEQFVGYLYPIVGSLVRKSVTAFITELLEKTNTLIENSLTIKGLKWRFKAWQAGVSFSQYAASQTFTFRVEQVFLIHRETGLLLNSVSIGLDTAADADMVSSMLTAINDFVSDSFKPNAHTSEQQLDVVRTDDFTLLLKPGPKAIVVAAITGNMPQKVANQLQVTLEEIHKLYKQELTQFNGDALVFENTENQLRDCLISELKAETTKTKSPPWMAWVVFALLLLASVFIAHKRWQAYQLMVDIEAIELEPGILITKLELSGLNQINLRLLRDPAAVSFDDWLLKQDIHAKYLSVSERAYLSLDHELIKTKLENLVQKYPKITVIWVENKPKLIGEITQLNKLLLQNELSTAAGLNFQQDWMQSLTVAKSDNDAANDPVIIRAILDLKIAKIDKMTVSFKKGVSKISNIEVDKLLEIKQQFNELIKLAEKQNLSIGLIIMGASDTIGSASFNKILSQKRADNVKQKLQELGVKEPRMNAIGLGVIDLKTTNEGARKVLFNVVYFDANE